MNTSEAIKGLDGFSEILASMSILVQSKILQEDADQQKYEHSQRLMAQLKQKLTDGRWFAQEILKEIHEVGVSSGDMAGISAAIQRYVTADRQASEALGKTNNAEAAPTALQLAIRAYREKQGIPPK